MSKQSTCRSQVYIGKLCACAEQEDCVTRVWAAKQALEGAKVREGAWEGPWVPPNQRGFCSVNGTEPLQRLSSVGSTIRFSFGVNGAGSSGGAQEAVWVGGCVLAWRQVSRGRPSQEAQ